MNLRLPKGVQVMKRKTIRRTTILPAGVEEIWDKLQQLSTLQYIAKPYATFRPLEEMTVWQAGEVSHFSLKLFGFLPMGVHRIQVVEFDKARLTIYTNESNKFVPVWNHRILLEQLEDGACLYRDEVEIGAGILTPVVALWAGRFYRHRQRKWIRLLAKDLPQRDESRK